MRRPPGLFARFGSLCLLAAMWMLPSVASGAYPGEFIALPAAGQKPRHGVRATVDARWVDGNGYRPVRVEISTIPPVPATADRSFQVELTATGWYGQVPAPTVTKTIELPEGASKTDAVLLVPQFSPWNQLEVRILEDGFELKEMRFNGSISNLYSNQWSESAPSMLFVDPDAPTLAVRERQFGVANGAFVQQFNANQNATPTEPTLPDVRGIVATFSYNYGNVSVSDLRLKPVDDDTTLRYITHVQQLEMLPPSELADDWLAYTCFDLIFISYQDLVTLANSSPSKVKALRQWVQTGPTMVVYGAGEQFERLTEIEKLLALSPLTGDQSESELRGWRQPTNGDRSKAFKAPRWNQNGSGQWIYQNGQQVWINNDGEKPVANTPDTLHDRRPISGNLPPFVVRQAGFGNVVAMSEPYPFPGAIQNWQWMLTTLGDSSWKWYQRHGLSMNRSNTHYWNWLVPGVGLPPVVSFLVLISIFVVVIGPVNYFVLGRMRRLYLLLVTVPLGAGVVTACLFLFALFTDGLGVKGRVRSVTLLDQPNRQAVTSSRQTYYAAIAPSRGLTFPDEAAVYPLELYPHSISRSDYGRREIVWDREQNLRSGFIRSRTQNQFFLLHPHESQAALRVKQPAKGGKKLLVENQLGTKLLHLVVTDFEGVSHYGQNIESETSTSLDSIDQQTLINTLRPVLREASPANPQYFDVNRYENAYSISRPWYYSQRKSTDSDQPAPTEVTSVLETRLRELSSQNYQLAPRHYFAITELSPEVAIGVSRVRERSSFHVIIGRY
ncbi:MAG: hypothetical protein KDA38_01750 [Planctomycetales bacterium]|nr:hypothetical protein [Planctomycetales bacterium]